MVKKLLDRYDAVAADMRDAFKGVYNYQNVLTMHKQMLKLTGMKYWFRLTRSKLLVRLMKAM